jgi:hypothetical protein
MFEQPDPTLQKILAALAPEENLGILLAAQVGGTPNEIQLIVQTTEHLEGEGERLRPTGQYIIRAISVVEHKLALGFFQTLVHSTSNALLAPHNEPRMVVTFKGQPANVDSLMIDLYQLYGQTYGIYDPTTRMADELNREQPLATLLMSGQGILGEMPASFAYRVTKLLERHGLACQLDEIEIERPDLTRQALILDDSYIIAQFFSADPMGQKG